MSSARNVAIIGGGPAGLSCAHELTKSGVSVEIFEASEEVGGMCRSFELWGQTVDLGPHRFLTSDPRVLAFFDQVLKGDHVAVDRLTRIAYNGQFFSYPLRAWEIPRKLAPTVVAKALVDYAREMFRSKASVGNLEDWLVSRFGRTLFEIFFKDYSEKLWGVPCKEIEASWAAQRIKGLSLGEVLLKALGATGRKHKTLAERFLYPRKGAGQLYLNAAEQIESGGGSIHLGCPVESVLVKKNRVAGLRLKDGQVVDADAVVSTMPLTHLVATLPDTPPEVRAAAEELDFRNTLLVYLEVDAPDVFDDNWIYVHSKQVKHGRITNFRNFSEALSNGKETSILCLEFWAYRDEQAWEEPDATLIERAKLELRQLELLPAGVQILNAKVARVPNCYPVYRLGYATRLAAVLDHLEEIQGLIPIGRYGSFRYNNQDHSIAMGLQAADSLLGRDSECMGDSSSDYLENGDFSQMLASLK